MVNIWPIETERFLAYELGVIEWHDRAIMQLVWSESEEDEEIRFFDFLSYYCIRKYGHESSDIFGCYMKFATQDLFHRERKLGFDSVNDGLTKPGHIPAPYLAEAIGVEWP